MIDINNILEWKQQYKDIYQLEIQNQHFIFKAIGREEYKQIILMDLDLGEFQETICFQSVIYPENYDYTKGIAGVAEVISDAILDASGLHVGQAADLLHEYRTEMTNYDYQVDCIIHEAFPEYPLEEISTWPVRKTMYYLSRSEWILSSLKGVPLQRIDESLQQQMQEPQYEQGIEEQQPQKEQNNPYQQEIRKELVEFEKPEVSKPKTQPQQKEGAIQSEEELLAMLAGTGQKIANPSTDMEDVKPELNWFSYMDELKGDFE